MDSYRIIDDPQKEDWDSFLVNFSSCNLQQSFEYGEVMKMSNPKTRIVRFLAFDRDHPVGLVQARYSRKFGFGENLEVGGLYGYGPIVAEIEKKEQISRELIAAVERWANRERVLSGSIYQLKRNSFLESLGYTLVNSFNTYKVLLSKNVENLWKSIEHNKRRNIKKAEGQGVEVTQDKSREGLVSFYELLDITAKRSGFRPFSFKFFDSCLKIFGEDKARIFFAIVKNQRVAGVFIVVYGDTAYALAAGSREEAWHVRPNDILHWKAMEWACSNGLLYYHLGSVPEPLPSEGSPLWSLWRWKKEWNGRLEKTFIYEKVYMPTLRKFILTGARVLHAVVRRK